MYRFLLVLFLLSRAALPGMAQRLRWEQPYDRPATLYDVGVRLQLTEAGEILVCGGGADSLLPLHYPSFLLRYAPDGPLLLLACDQAQGGRVTNSFYLVHLSAQGQLLRQTAYPSRQCGSLRTYDFQSLPDGSHLVVGGYTRCAGSPAIAAYLARTDSVATVLAARPARPLAASEVEGYPNPATDELTLRYRVPAGTRTAEVCFYSLLGQCLLLLPAPAGEHTINYPVTVGSGKPY